MHLVMQPNRSRCCGQACVAMVANVSLKKSIGVFGHARRTRYRHLISALNRFKVKCGRSMIRVKHGTIDAERAIVRIRWNNQNNSHWIVLWNGNIYCPAYGKNSLGVWNSFTEMRHTSFLKIG